MALDDQPSQHLRFFSLPWRVLGRASETLKRRREIVPHSRRRHEVADRDGYSPQSEHELANEEDVLRVVVDGNHNVAEQDEKEV